ncbi:hypothetical protein [Paenibacillus segetis]|uniref:Uncharacterized protein n=1 Tax=Paenibacillus segetis TaxID=1325360 RepID=A0ABQ1Y9G0_9BACL|nr:hypothetical protein [Paenibacillus segetis]GGH17347.1 hypothetical protein GCM10008013_12620 [Paenibacillus segetis]
MSIEIGELRARMTADAQEIKAEIKNVKKDIADLGEQGKKTAGDIKSVDSALGKLGSSKEQITRLTAVLDNVNARIELQRQKLAMLKESYNNTFNAAAKSKLQEQILKTEGTLLQLTQTSDNTAKKIWTLEDSLNQVADGGQQAATGMDTLDNVLRDIGLSAEQIKIVKKNLDGVDPTKLDHQLDELSVALKKLGIDSQQIEKITNELRGTELEATKTKQGINGLASGLAALGAGAATARAANTVKTLASEAHQLAISYMGLGEVAKSFHVDTEESINLAEKLADRWGLDKGVLSDTVKTYLSLNMSLDETEKIITATADAAVYNREAHLSWGDAIKQVSQGIKSGNSNLTDAAGITTNLSVMQDRYAKSIGTTAAKLTESQKVQAAYNGMMQEASLFAGNADSAMTGYTGTQATFNQTIETARVELGEAFLPVIQDLMEMVTPIIKDFSLWASENKEVVAGIAAATIAVGGLITVLTTAITVVSALRMAFVALNITMGPIGWAIAAFSAVTLGVTAYTSAASEASKEVQQLASSQEELNRKLNESPFSRSVEDLKGLQDTESELNVILEERIKLRKRLDELDGLGIELSRDRELLNEARETNEAINQLDKRIKGLGFKNIEDATKRQKELREEIEDSIPALREMEREELATVAAKVKHVDKVNALKKEYESLNAKVKLSTEEKQRLNDVVQALTKEYPGLLSNLDKENRWHIKNYDSLGDLIQAEKDSIAASADASKKRLANWKTETEAKLKLARMQLNALEGLDNPSKVMNSKIPAAVGDVLERIQKGTAANVQKSINGYQLEINEIDKDIQAITEGAFDKFVTGAGDSAAKDNKKTKDKTGKSAAEIARDLRKQAYDTALATAQYQAEMYDWTADQQIKAYEKIRKQHQQHLKESIDDERQMNLQLKRLQEDSIQSRYDFSAEWINREEGRMEKSSKTEIEIAQMKVDAWTRVRDRYDKDSEYYKEADDKLFESRKALISALEKAMKDLYSSTSDFLKQEERKLEESGASETEIAQMKLELWTRIRDSYAKASDYYKQADEQVYQAKKNLISQIQKDNEAARKVEKQSITDAKKLELDAITERRKAYTDDIDERIAAIDRLIKAEDRLNSEQDYESLLAEKKARQAKLEDAVSPEGRQEYADITKEIERMELEHSRDIRKQNLEDQKEALQDEKSERERAFDKEKSDAEAHYDALTDALENYQDDVKLMETGLQDFRVDASQTANAQILSDLDSFVSAYNSKLASLTTVSGPSQQSSDLQEYNANKDAYDAAKLRGDKAEMERLSKRNDAIRKQYGIEKDTGKLDQLPSYDVGGRVPGPDGSPMAAIIHGGEAIFNPQQLDNLFRMLEVPRALPVFDRSDSKGQTVINNNFDMSVGTVEVADSADAEILYTPRERTARRLATVGGGK